MPISLIVTGAASAAYAGASASGVSVGTFVASIVSTTLGGLGLGGGAVALYHHNSSKSSESSQSLDASKNIPDIQKKIKQLPQHIEQSNKSLVDNIKQCQKSTHDATQQMKTLEAQSVPKIKQAIEEAKQAAKTLNKDTLPELKKTRDEAQKTKDNIDVLALSLKEKEDLLLQSMQKIDAIVDSLKVQENNNNRLGNLVEKKLSIIEEQAKLIKNLELNLAEVRASSKKLEAHSIALESGIKTLQQEVESLESERKKLLDKNKELESKHYHLHKQWKNSAAEAEANKSHITQLELRHSELMKCFEEVKSQFTTLEELFNKYKESNQTLVAENKRLSQSNAEKQKLLDEFKPYMEKATQQLMFFKRELKNKQGLHSNNLKNQTQQNSMH